MKGNSVVSTPRRFWIWRRDCGSVNRKRMTRLSCRGWRYLTFRRDALPLPDITEGERTHYRYTRAPTDWFTNNGSAHCRPDLSRATALPLVTALMAEVGVGELDYLATRSDTLPPWDR
ncbi:MAG: hypothetical protein CM15mP74_04810 [Halieaceae bacterium]|nr:MAG: hypothetical protein CM15mP74_04810 [Halieaceae bacterium]